MNVQVYIHISRCLLFRLKAKPWLPLVYCIFESACLELLQSGQLERAEKRRRLLQFRPLEKRYNVRHAHTRRTQ